MHLLILLASSTAAAGQPDTLAGITTGAALPRSARPGEAGRYYEDVTVAGVAGRAFLDVCEGSVNRVSFRAGAMNVQPSADESWVQTATDPATFAEELEQTFRAGLAQAGWSPTLDRSRKSLDHDESTARWFPSGIETRLAYSTWSNGSAARTLWAGYESHLAAGNTMNGVWEKSALVELSTSELRTCSSGL